MFFTCISGKVLILNMLLNMLLKGIVLPSEPNVDGIDVSKEVLHPYICTTSATLMEPVQP